MDWTLLIYVIVLTSCFIIITFQSRRMNEDLLEMIHKMKEENTDDHYEFSKGLEDVVERLKYLTTKKIDLD